jgi:hypothetical protein
LHTERFITREMVMDSDRFDRLARMCASRLPRRSALGLAAAGIGAALSLLERDDAAAKCGKKKPCPACKACKKGKCKKQKDGTACGDGHVCAGGVCQCPDGQKPCDDGCIASEACCDRGDCGNQEDCCNRSCVNIATRTDCGSCGHACGAGEDCCNGDCVDVTTRLDCGACGNVCPGQTGTSDAVCVDPAASRCDITCRGDNYDVDGNPANGCERLDLGGGHTQATATSLGSGDCNASGSFVGTILSDGRQHANPQVNGFDASTGSAPDWWTVVGTGGVFCSVNLLEVTITTSGGSSPGQCYRLTIDVGTGSPIFRSIGGDDSVTIENVEYPDNSRIYFKIEKTCGTSVREAVRYSVDYQL